MTDPGLSPSTPPESAPDWGSFARAGEWRRALAAARLTPTPAALRGALEGIVNVQEAVRARSLGQARRALAGLQDDLEAAAGEGLTGEVALLRALVRPGALGEALTVLEATRRAPGGETEPEALNARLVPALEHPLTRAEALNAVGVLHALREEPEAARAAFGEALNADPAHYRAMTNLGNLELEAGQPAQAEARYREVLRLNPDYDGAHHNLGVALRRQGKLHESVGAIRRGQRLGMKRSREESREDLREQFGHRAPPPALRWVLIAVGVLVLFLLLRGGLG